MAEQSDSPQRYSVLVGNTATPGKKKPLLTLHKYYDWELYVIDGGEGQRFKRERRRSAQRRLSNNSFPKLTAEFQDTGSAPVDISDSNPREKTLAHVRKVVLFLPPSFPISRYTKTKPPYTWSFQGWQTCTVSLRIYFDHCQPLVVEYKIDFSKPRTEVEVVVDNDYLHPSVENSFQFQQSRKQNNKRKTPRKKTKPPTDRVFLTSSEAQKKQGLREEVDEFFDQLVDEPCQPEDLSIILQREEELRLKRLKLQGITDTVTKVGVAFSGGGIRSASFATGALEAFKHHGLLSEIDFVSTVSGGGYAGSAFMTHVANADLKPFENKINGCHEVLNTAFTNMKDRMRTYCGYLIDKRTWWKYVDMITMWLIVLVMFLLGDMTRIITGMYPLGMLIHSIYKEKLLQSPPPQDLFEGLLIVNCIGAALLGIGTLITKLTSISKTYYICKMRFHTESRQYMFGCLLQTIGILVELPAACFAVSWMMAAVNYQLLLLLAPIFICIGFFIVVVSGLQPGQFTWLVFPSMAVCIVGYSWYRLFIQKPFEWWPYSWIFPGYALIHDYVSYWMVAYVSVFIVRNFDFSKWAHIYNRRCLRESFHADPTGAQGPRRAYQILLDFLRGKGFKVRETQEVSSVQREVSKRGGPIWLCNLTLNRFQQHLQRKYPAFRASHFALGGCFSGSVRTGFVPTAKLQVNIDSAMAISAAALSTTVGNVTVKVIDYLKVFLTLLSVSMSDWIGWPVYRKKLNWNARIILLFYITFMYFGQLNLSWSHYEFPVNPEQSYLQQARAIRLISLGMLCYVFCVVLSTNFPSISEVVCKPKHPRLTTPTINPTKYKAKHLGYKPSYYPPPSDPLFVWKEGTLLSEALRTNVINPTPLPYLNVSDGGHYDNLGLLPLLDRRCSVMFVFDAGEDPFDFCEDLSNIVKLFRKRGFTFFVDKQMPFNIGLKKWAEQNPFRTGKGRQLLTSDEIESIYYSNDESDEEHSTETDNESQRNVENGKLKSALCITVNYPAIRDLDSLDSPDESSSESTSSPSVGHIIYCKMRIDPTIQCPAWQLDITGYFEVMWVMKIIFFISLLIWQPLGFVAVLNWLAEEWKTWLPLTTLIFMVSTWIWGVSEHQWENIPFIPTWYQFFEEKDFDEISTRGFEVASEGINDYFRLKSRSLLSGAPVRTLRTPHSTLNYSEPILSHVKNLSPKDARRPALHKSEEERKPKSQLSNSDKNVPKIIHESPRQQESAIGPFLKRTRSISSPQKLAPTATPEKTETKAESRPVPAIKNFGLLQVSSRKSPIRTDSPSKQTRKK